MAFTRDWTPSSPANSDDASQGALAIRNFKVDVADRLSAMFYGFVAGETTYDAHAKQITFREQASVAAPAANTGALYTKEVSGVAELHYKDENDNEKQITSGGKLNIVAGDIAANLLDDTKVRGRNNQPFRWRNAVDSADISGLKVNASNVLELMDGTVMASSAAPSTDPGIANKKYVDDEVAAVALTITKSATAAKIEYPGGLIEQNFKITSTADNDEAFTFPEAFASTCIAVYLSHGTVRLSSVVNTGFTVNRDDGIDGDETIYVRALGY